MTLENTIERLNLAAKQRQGEAKNEKQCRWMLIKEKTPDIANFLILFNNGFGKPKALKIEIGGKVIFETGEFEKCKFQNIIQFKINSHKKGKTCKQRN